MTLTYKLLDIGFGSRSNISKINTYIVTQVHVPEREFSTGGIFVTNIFCFGSDWLYLLSLSCLFAA